MAAAIIQLIVAIIIGSFLYWCLGKLWPLTREFGSSWAGQVVFVLLLILIVFGVLFYGVIPFLHALADLFGGGGAVRPFRW